MARDEDLARRIRALLADEPQVVEMSMFGGRAFLVTGHMAAGASARGGLMLRCAPSDTHALVAKPHAHPFETRGKAVSGWLRVDAEGTVTDDELESWVWPAVEYARSLPPKG